MDDFMPTDAAMDAAAEAGEECGASSGRGDDYNMSLRIGAIFVIFAVSLLGTMIPVIGRRSKVLQLPKLALKSLLGFGTGVVIATAFIHMIPPAMDALSDPCLGSVSENYESLALVFVIGTILLMQVAEVLLAKQIEAIEKRSSNALHEDVTEIRHPHSGRSVDVAEVLEHGPHGDTYPTSDFKAVVDPGVTSPVDEVAGVKRAANQNHIQQPQHDHHHHHHVLPTNVSKLSTRLKVAAIVFEIGVCLHSVIIGVDLGVTEESSFITLFVALSFHQFFEGVAVGSTVTEAYSEWRSILSVCIGYACTTPIGILIGILISSSYSSTSASALWTRGILDAIAGGILIYTGLVELLTYQFTTNVEFAKQSAAFQTVTYLCIFAGAAGMAVVGIWA